MKIGILQTGRSPETLQKNFGDYNDLFMKLFKQQDFEFTTYAVIDSIFPKNPYRNGCLVNYLDTKRLI